MTEVVVRHIAAPNSFTHLTPELLDKLLSE